MVQGKCINPNCTVAETGICLESHTNIRDCPNFIVAENQAAAEGEVTSISLPEDQLPPISHIPAKFARQFHSGNELGSIDAVTVMRRRYTSLVGVLGSTNAGKTCLLSSFYLIASQAEMTPDYLFAGSLTLQGFEERVRRLRVWREGRLPDQLVEHTRLEDPRRPAFMHLCIKETKPKGKFIDILMTDLPGEWTDNLIKSKAAATRLDFLKRADGILYVVDGPLLMKRETKHLEIYNTTVAVDRLVEDIIPNMSVPLVFVISKCDEIDMQVPEGTQAILKHAERYGLTASIVLTASISRKPDRIHSGTGVMNAIEAAIKPIRSSGKENNEWEPLERSFWSVPSF